MSGFGRTAEFLFLRAQEKEPKRRAPPVGKTVVILCFQPEVRKRDVPIPLRTGHLHAATEFKKPENKESQHASRGGVFEV